MRKTKRRKVVGLGFMLGGGGGRERSATRARRESLGKEGRLLS